MRDGRRAGFVAGMALMLSLALLALIPTNYYLLSPGTAVDLSRRVAVEGHAPSERRFFLTDVTVQRATVLLLLEALEPGTRLVKHDVLLPPGETMHSYDHVLSAAMDDSQHVAAYVAENAAGFKMGAPLERIVVAQILPQSHALGVIAIGDRLLRVAGRPIRGPRDTAKALDGQRPGTRIPIDVERNGHVVHVTVATIEFANATRLGIETQRLATMPELPVPVRYSLQGVEGSSGGLMFALAIYSALTDDRRASSPVAGTGTIASDGTVGPIEGTKQKLIAAERAGAKTFLVPTENYPDIKDERGITIVPVHTFAAALEATQRSD